MVNGVDDVARRCQPRYGWPGRSHLDDYRLIGFGPFHHALLGTTEVLAAVFIGQGITFGQFGRFLLWTTLGNVAGGTVFVALLNYGQAIKAGDPGDVNVDPESIGES
jgi:hypothetical protein